MALSTSSPSNQLETGDSLKLTQLFGINVFSRTTLTKRCVKFLNEKMPGTFIQTVGICSRVYCGHSKLRIRAKAKLNE